MDAFLIKLGKVWSVLRRDGMFRGGQRILGSVSMLFRRVEAGDVLFIASGVGDSARYRCHHVAESLRLQGFRVSVVPQTVFRPSRFSEKFSVFVFHRTSWTPAVETFVRRLEALKKTVVFDTDDLTFDAELFKRTAAYAAMNTLERRQYRNGIGVEFLESSVLSAVTTSTTFLAEKLCAFGKPVFIVPNCLSGEDVRIAEAILESRAKSQELRMRNKEVGNTPHTVTLGYFSGSTGHDRDFATVAPVLKRLLDEFQQLRIFIGGPLVLSKLLESYSARIDRVSFVPRAENFRNIAKVDINIAPLEIGDPFCEAKSELKFFEAGILSVPTIAAATQTFREAIRDGENGYIAMNEEDWYKKASRLISESDFRRTLGEKARETTLRNYTTSNANNHEYVTFLRTMISRSQLNS